MIRNFKAHEGYLEAVVSGQFSLDVMKAEFLKILQAMKEADRRKLLFDGRAVTGAPKDTDRFKYGAFVAEQVAALEKTWPGKPLQLAYVMLPPVRDPDRFGENVANNRGATIMTFGDPRDALRWLAIPNP